MPSGTLIINPVTIPTAAGLDFGGGDVRHFAPGDAVSTPGLANPTRYLAQRDNIMASKINEIVDVVNNKEAYQNLPTMKLNLPPTAAEIITNYRIPAGFEARVLNAIISSNPSSAATLDIFYNASTFGGTTGTSVVSTGSEFSGGVQFFGVGEFIVRITNNSPSSIDVVASVTLTVRPVGATAGGIIGPGAVGPPGPVGGTGATGGVGPIGSPGSQGAPGLTWRGAWNSVSTYNQRDVVFYQGSSYIALVSSTNQPPPAPSFAPDTYWDLVAEEGAAANTGSQGIQGPAGFVFRDEWSNATLYVNTDVVTYTTGSLHRTFYSNGSAAIGIPPPSSSSGWTELFGPSSGPVYTSQVVNGALVTEGGFVAGTTEGDYFGLSAGTTTFPFQEISIQGGAPGGAYNGVSHLRANTLLNYGGPVLVTLPQVVDGARLNWNNSDVYLEATTHGTLVIVGTQVRMLDVSLVGANAFRVSVLNPSATHVELTFDGWGFLS